MEGFIYGAVVGLELDGLALICKATSSASSVPSVCTMGE